MKIQKPIQKLEMGYAIKRQFWPESKAIKRNGLSVIDGEGDAPELSYEDLLADDWEVIPKLVRKYKKQEASAE